MAYVGCETDPFIGEAPSPLRRGAFVPFLSFPFAIKVTIMAHRRFHYDAAFEHYLRAKTIPYVVVDEARKALHGQVKLKSFDFVVYGSKGDNLLVDVKGRKHTGRSHKHFDNWVTEDDIESLRRWEQVFGEGFIATFVFLYWCEAQPPDALFHEVFELRDRWYAVLAISVKDYADHMTMRSPKWKTVNLPAEDFARLSRPLTQLI